MARHWRRQEAVCEAESCSPAALAHRASWDIIMTATMYYHLKNLHHGHVILGCRSQMSDERTTCIYIFSSYVCAFS